jgi:hypothetical protein
LGGSRALVVEVGVATRWVLPEPDRKEAEGSQTDRYVRPHRVLAPGLEPVGC